MPIPRINGVGVIDDVIANAWEQDIRAPVNQDPDWNRIRQDLEPRLVGPAPIPLVQKKKLSMLPEDKSFSVLPEKEPDEFFPDLPTFFQKYEYEEEIRRRLDGTVITAKRLPYLVSNVHKLKNSFALSLSDGNQIYFVEYSPELELRSVHPGYVLNLGGVFLARKPARNQQQGWSPDNTIFKRCGGLPFRDDILGYLEPIRSRKIRKWSPEIETFMKDGIFKSIPLSLTIAVYIENEKILAEYKGRKLGEIRDDSVVLTEPDKLMSWVHRDLHRIGLKATGDKNG